MSHGAFGLNQEPRVSTMSYCVPTAASSDGVPDDWKQDQTDELLVDLATVYETVDGVHQELCSNGNKLSKI